MTWRADHEWEAGASLPAVVAGRVVVACRLSTCEQCATLRVIDASTGVATYIRRAAEESARVLDVSPPCVPAPRFFYPPGDAVPSVNVLPPDAPAIVVERRAPSQLGLW